MYIPKFKCPYCKTEKSSFLSSAEEGLFIPCDCEESRKAMEHQHRVEMERRKQLRRSRR